MPTTPLTSLLKVLELPLKLLQATVLLSLCPSWGAEILLCSAPLHSPWQERLGYHSTQHIMRTRNGATKLQCYQTFWQYQNSWGLKYFMFIGSILLRKHSFHNIFFNQELDLIKIPIFLHRFKFQLLGLLLNRLSSSLNKEV